jgi:hypothetical protein
MLPEFISLSCPDSLAENKLSMFQFSAGWQYNNGYVQISRRYCAGGQKVGNIPPITRWFQAGWNRTARKRPSVHCHGNRPKRYERNAAEISLRQRVKSNTDTEQTSKVTESNSVHGSHFIFPQQSAKYRSSCRNTGRPEWLGEAALTVQTVTVKIDRTRLTAKGYDP